MCPYPGYIFLSLHLCPDNPQLAHLDTVGVYAIMPVSTHLRLSQPGVPIHTLLPSLAQVVPVYVHRL